MDKSKGIEIKVGIFVAVGLILLATLLLQFSKSASIFRGSYEVRLHAANVGGIKPRAQVLLAGVQVGTVGDIQLAPDGRSVTILLTIYKDYPIYHDAEFVIQQAGFLGDQYVSINPTYNTLPMLTNGANVTCEAPFDLQETARSASGLITRIDNTVKKLDASVDALQRQVLNQRTLSNLDVAINNLRGISEQAMATVSNLDGLVITNRDRVGLAVSNLVFFSHQLNGLANSASDILASNGVQVSLVTKNLADSSQTLKDVVSDVQAGKGLAGTILQNQQLSANVQMIAANLAETSSNLNQRGIWGIMWAHKHHDPPAETSTNNTPAK